MTTTKYFSAGKVGFMVCSSLLGVLTGCVYAQEPPRVVYAEAPRVEAVVVVSPVVEIRAESDFYEPLTEYGRWEVVGGYGRCWIPARVEADWRPYCNGNWQRTEAGWYWASEEPWGWATYHYGRWDLSPQFGWYWVPQTQWAPAWVSWHEGGGYVGWAPLQPSVTISVSGYVGFNESRISPRAYVFVEQRRFLEPVRPATVVVNNTTIINKTTVINNTKIVNKTVINEGPRTTIIEQASGRKVQPVAIQELRRKEEAPVSARRQNVRANPDNQAVAPARTVASPEKQAPAPGRAVAEPINKNVTADPARRVQPLDPKIQVEAPKDAGDVRKKAQAESEQRESQKAARELARKNQLEAEQRLNEQRVKQAEQRVPAVPARNQDSEKKALREFDPAQKVVTEPQRPGKDEKIKKGVKEGEGKGGGKKPDQRPVEKLVEPAPPKN